MVYRTEILAIITVKTPSMNAKVVVTSQKVAKNVFKTEMCSYFTMMLNF